MAVQTVNGAVLIPNPPNWAERVIPRRYWDNEVLPALSSAEERTNFKPVAYRGVEWSPLVGSLQELNRLTDKVMAALKLGAVAVPFWSRGAELRAGYAAGATSIAVNTLWNWTIGDYLFLLKVDRLHDVTFEVVTVTSVASGGAGIKTLGLSSGINFAVKAGELVWPFLFGTLQAEALQQLTNWKGSCRFRVREPITSGVLGVSSCGVAVPPVVTGSGYHIFDLIPDVTLHEASVCAGDLRLEWEDVIGADTYRVYSSATSGGALTLLADSAALLYSFARPPWVGKYFRVSSVSGGKESDKCAEIYVTPRTIEREMRAMQERFRASQNLGLNDGGGVFLLFPGRTLPTAIAAGNYPPEGFYDADIAASVQFKEDLLTDLCLQFYYFDWIENFATVEEWAGLSVIPVHDVTTITPVTSTAGTVDADLLAIAQRICLLQYLKILPVWRDGIFREVESKQPHDDSDASHAEGSECIKRHFVSLGNNTKIGLGSFCQGTVNDDLCAYNKMGGVFNCAVGFADEQNASGQPISYASSIWTNSWPGWGGRTGIGALLSVTSYKSGVDLTYQLAGTGTLFARLFSGSGHSHRPRVYDYGIFYECEDATLGIDWTASKYVLDHHNPFDEFTYRIQKYIEIEQFLRIIRTNNGDDGHWTHYP